MCVTPEWPLNPPKAAAAAALPLLLCHCCQPHCRVRFFSPVRFDFDFILTKRSGTKEPVTSILTSFRFCFEFALFYSADMKRVQFSKEPDGNF